jgi:hypothetical protein
MGWPLSQMDHDDGILAAGKEEDGTFELGGDFAQDVDRLVLKLLEMGQVIGTHGAEPRKLGRDPDMSKHKRI